MGNQRRVAQTSQIAANRLERILRAKQRRVCLALELRAALAVVLQATNNTVLAASRADLLTLSSMLAKAGRADQRLLDSFRSQKDQEVVVALTKGPEQLLVRDVQDDAILV